jgi:hypothetical protein
MGIRSGGCSLATVRSSGGGAVFEAPLLGGGGTVVMGPLGGGGGSGGHTSDPVSYVTGLGFLAPSHGARVLIGRPHGLIRIHVVWSYGGGHTSDPVSYETGLAFLAPSRGARVPVGRPRGPIRIHVVWLYGDLGGVDSGTGMTSTG